MAVPLASGSMSVIRVELLKPIVWGQSNITKYSIQLLANFLGVGVPATRYQLGIPHQKGMGGCVLTSSDSSRPGLARDLFRYMGLPE